MGKVGKLIVAAVGIGINVIPGVGQVLSAGIIGLGGGTFAAVGVAQAVFAGLSLAGVAAGLSLAASLFAPGAPKPEAGSRQVRSPTPPRLKLRGQRRTYGSVVLFESGAAGEAIDVMAYLDGRIQSVEAVYLNDDPVTITGGAVNALADGGYKDGNVLAGYTLGAATETAFAAVIAALPGIWTSDHRGDGVVSGYLIKKPVKSKDFLTVYPQSDNVAMSLVCNSWHLFDPREPGQDWNDDDTWAGPFDNPVLSLLSYLVIDRGEDYATRLLPVIDYWIAAADICDSARPLKAGGSEKLYRCGIIWDVSATKPSEIIAEHLKTFDGWIGEDDDGHILIYAGQLYEPTVSIGAAEITDYEVKNFVEAEDRVNEVVISYVSSLHDWNTVEASAWRDDSDIAERGVVVSTTFEPQVPSHAQAQYLAPRLAAKSNAPYSGTISTNYSGRKVIGHRYIELTVTEGGHLFYAGIAEVLTIEKNQAGGVVFTWAAVNPALDDWNPAIDEGDPAPVGDSPPVEPIDPPEITAAVAQFDGGSARIAVTADSPDRADLNWYLHWRVDGETIWNEQEYGDIAQGTSVDLLSDLVPTDQSIEVEVAYSTGDGRFSGWSATETVSTSTAGLAPGPVTNVTASGGVGQITVNWRNPGSPNYAFTRNYYGTTNVFGSATALSPDDAAGALAVRSATYSGIAPGTKHVWSRSFSAAGVGSSPVYFGTVTVT